MKKDPSQDICFYVLGWCFLALLVVIIIVYMVTDGSVLSMVPPCMFHLITGFYCPGCGGSRAVYELLHGHLLRSLFYHPFVPYVAICGGWFMISQTIERVSGHRITIAMHYRNIYVWIALALIFGNWIIKNCIIIFTGVPVMG